MGWGSMMTFISPLMRAMVVFMLAALLAACSGSSRVEHIVPGWANSPRHSAPRPEPRKEAEIPSGAAAAPREAARPNPPGPAEE